MSEQMKLNPIFQASGKPPFHHFRIPRALVSSDNFTEEKLRNCALVSEERALYEICAHVIPFTKALKTLMDLLHARNAAM